MFLTSDEVVEFESKLGAEALEPLLAEPELWEAAAAWRDHLADSPRLAENVFSWVRAEPSSEVPSALPSSRRLPTGSTFEASC